MTYQVNEIFYSLQGEGARAGSANIFVRFSGCNLKCNGTMDDQAYLPVCDTEFTSGRKMSGDEIIDFCKEIAPTANSVIFTGGEPALQLDNDLIDKFKMLGFFTSIETNGTINVDHLFLNWVSVSPKIAEHAIKQLKASEVRYVRSYGQGIPKTKIAADHHFISPASDGANINGNNIQWCIKLIKENPVWKLSIQQHKIWNVR